MTKEYSLGLDISTSRTGYCILDKDGKIINLNAIDFTNAKNFPSMNSKAEAMEILLQEIKNQYNITKITIESALQMFRPGASSATTISTLMRFNGIVSWLTYKIFNFEPNYIASGTARKICGIKIPKGKKAKLVVMEYLMMNELQFLPFVKHTRTGSISPGSYDMADAFVIAKASLNNN